jgi:hypothetical protein
VETQDIPTAIQENGKFTPYKGVTWVMPPIKTIEHETLVVGWCRPGWKFQVLSDEICKGKQTWKFHRQVNQADHTTIRAAIPNAMRNFKQQERSAKSANGASASTSSLNETMQASFITSSVLAKMRKRFTQVRPAENHIQGATQMTILKLIAGLVAAFFLLPREIYLRITGQWIGPDEHTKRRAVQIRELAQAAHLNHHPVILDEDNPRQCSACHAYVNLIVEPHGLCSACWNERFDATTERFNGDHN